MRWRVALWRALPFPLMTVLIGGQQCSYLWTKKQKQYIERAAAVEQLVVLA
jgi:hypothetical protein